MDPLMNQDGKNFVENFFGTKKKLDQIVVKRSTR